MKKIVFIVVFSIFSLCIYSQTYIYEFKDSISTMQLTIVDNRYEISFARTLTIDMYEGTLLSRGDVIRNDSLMILRDKKCGFEIVLSKINNTVVPVDRFPIFLENKQFRYFVSSSMLAEDLEKLEFGNPLATNNIINLDSLKVSEKKLNFGRYSNYDYCTIWINNDGTYKVDGEFFCISEGLWKENDYTIELYDKSLRFVFKGLKLECNKIYIKLPESKQDIFSF